MFRKFTLNTILALALVTAPIATPAAFARDDTDRLLIALTALGVLGVIAHESNESHSRPTYVQPRPQPRTYYHSNHYVRPPQHAFVPPKQCLRQKWTRSGWVRFYNQACVNKFRPVAYNRYNRR